MENTGEKVNITGGTLKGFIDMRDGIGGEEQPLPGVPASCRVRLRIPDSFSLRLIITPNTRIPYYMRTWNLFAHTLMITFNEIHSQGYTLNGETGINFFRRQDRP